MSAQDDTGPLPARLEALRGQLENDIASRDPVVRGEAALALALTRDARYYPAILAISRDRAPAARIRGLLGLGLIATPGAESHLGDVLLDHKSKPGDKAAAALALGLLPEGQEAPAIGVFIRQVHGGSYKRFRAPLAGLLIGLSQAPHPDQAPSLHSIIEDASNREPELRFLATRALMPIRDALTPAEVEKLLRSSAQEDRLAALAALTGGRLGLADEKDMKLIERMAKKDRASAVRAAAIDTLTAARKVVALDAGVVAIDRHDAAELAAGVRAICRLGSGDLRAALDGKIMSAPAHSVPALLAAYEGTPSDDLVAWCLRTANDADQDNAVRIEAGSLAARAGERRVGAALRDLFFAAEEGAQLRTLATAITQLDPTLLREDRILHPDSAAGSRMLPARIGALLAADHPAAEHVLKAALESEGLEAKARAMVLRALRYSALKIDEIGLSVLPEDLAAVLH